MQCRNCKCEIPPAFVTAIANNSCPGCGKEIMSESDQELMTSLSEAMERMPNDPQGLAGWLLSNYKLQPIGTAEPVERFYRAGQIQSKVSEDNTNIFMERAGYKQKEDLASKIQKLKQNKNMAPLAEAMQANFEDDEEISVDDETSDLEDQKALAEFGKLMSHKNKPVKNKDGIVTAADMAKLIKKQATAPQQIDYNEIFDEANAESEFEEAVPQGYLTEEELALQASAAGRQLINQERIKRIKGQDALRSGGGSFKR